jgi:glycosyltransferase involved in cell wall biosynthesis
VWAQTILPGLLASDKFDALWAQLTSLPISLKRWCIRILTIHDLVPCVMPESMRFRSWLRMRLMLGPVARAADALVADSQATATLACRYLGIKQERISIVYPAAQREFKPIPKELARSKAAGEFWVSGDYVLGVGTIEPRRNHLTLLDAIKSVPDAPLLVLSGEKGWRCRHMAQIRAHEEGGRVMYVGRVSEDLLPVLYSAANLSVYPSLYKEFGLPVLESEACRSPVMCSWSASLPEVGEKPPAIFRPRDADDLAYRLSTLLSDEDRLADMRAMGLFRQQAPVPTGLQRRWRACLVEIVRHSALRSRCQTSIRPRVRSASQRSDLGPGRWRREEHECRQIVNQSLPRPVTSLLSWLSR